MKTSRAHAQKIGRLLKRADFLRVQSSPIKWVTPNFILQVDLRVDESKRDTCRFGLTITKKIFPNATDRNRVRRRFRALMIDILTEKGIYDGDFVLFPRVPSLKTSHSDLKKEVSWALKRILDKKVALKPQKDLKNDK